jgi:hypothetical protein
LVTTTVLQTAWRFVEHATERLTNLCDSRV